MPAIPPDRSRAQLGSLKPLVPYALAYRGRIAAAIAALTAASAATLALPVAARRVIDHGFSEGGGELIDAYFAVLVAVVGILAAASATRFYLVVTLGERIVADLRSAVFRRLTLLDPAFFDAARSGDLVSRLTADTTQVKSAFGVSISMALRNVALFLGALAMMTVTSLKLSGLVILAIPLIVLPLVLSGRAVQRRARAAQDRLADASAYAAEAVGAVRTMQAFGMEAMTAARFGEAAEAAFRRVAHLVARSRLAHRRRDLPRLGERRGSPMVGRARCARGPHDGRAAVAIRALRRVRGELAWAALRGLR